jgi:hypothetical protein
LAALEQALQQPTGFASYDALRQWVQQTYHLDVNYHTLYTIVRTNLKAKLKVPRPSHTKNPEAIEASQATCGEQFLRLITAMNTRSVHVFSQDESRFGLLTVRRRRLTARGVQLIGVVKY